MSALCVYPTLHIVWRIRGNDGTTKLQPGLNQADSDPNKDDIARELMLQEVPSMLSLPFFNSTPLNVRVPTLSMFLLVIC